MDPFTAQHTTARKGDFIKDLSPRERSLGIVMLVNEDTNMMHVKFPKIGKLNWMMWRNYGHYLVI
jgi:hypothetical protein